MTRDEADKLAPAPSVPSPAPGLRLRRVILLETFLVALAGMLVWGAFWEMSLPRVGLALAIVIWLTVSPAIEISSVMKYRRDVSPRRP